MLMWTRGCKHVHTHTHVGYNHVHNTCQVQTCTCMYVEARGNVVCLLYFWEKLSHWTCVHWLTRLAANWAPRDSPVLLSPPLRLWPLCLLHRCEAFELRPSSLGSQHFTDLRHPFSSVNIILISLFSSDRCPQVLLFQHDAKELRMRNVTHSSLTARA